MSSQKQAPRDLRPAVRRLAGAGLVLGVGNGKAVDWLGSWFDHVVRTNVAGALAAMAEENVVLVVVEVAAEEDLVFFRRVYEIRPQLTVVAVASAGAPLAELLNRGFGVLFDPDEGLLLERLHHQLAAAHERTLLSRQLVRLENEVKLRTDELRESRVEVIRLQEARDNMLALISHEIRTPLNGILGFIDLLRSPDAASDAMFLTHVEESARRLERSTRKALDFTSLSTGLRAPQKQPHRLSALLQAATEQLGAAITVSQEGPDVLETDGDLAVQVFRNLLENAVKYAGIHPQVHVTLCREGRWDVVSVSDTGPGFTPEAMPTLFQPFTTGGILHHAEGMGLGLALVDVIMLTLGGRAEAGNGPSGGAVVRLRFPVRES